MKKSAQTIIREDTCYTIAAANGHVLEVADFNTENGASVRLWSYEGQPWQQWYFVEAAENEYRIKNRFTGKVMDLAMTGVANGTWVHQWTVTSGAGQRWQLMPGPGGKTKIRNVLANKVIDLVGMRVENGTQAQIWQDVYGENQLWAINPVSARAQEKELPAAPAKTGPAPSTRIQTGRGTRAKKAAGKTTTGRSVKTAKAKR